MANRSIPGPFKRLISSVNNFIRLFTTKVNSLLVSTYSNLTSYNFNELNLDEKDISNLAQILRLQKKYCEKLDEVLLLINF